MKNRPEFKPGDTVLLDVSLRPKKGFINSVIIDDDSAIRYTFTKKIFKTPARRVYFRIAARVFRPTRLLLTEKIKNGTISSI